MLLLGRALVLNSHYLIGPLLSFLKKNCIVEMVVAKINRNSCLNFWKLILRTFILLACCDWQLSRNTTIHFIKFWIHNIFVFCYACLIVPIDSEVFSSTTVILRVSEAGSLTRKLICKITSCTWLLVRRSFSFWNFVEPHDGTTIRWHHTMGPTEKASWWGKVTASAFTISR